MDMMEACFREGVFNEGLCNTEKKANEVSLGTTIMAAKYDGGVVIGADSRTSSGSYVVNRTALKLTPIIPPYIYCCRSGSASDTIALADIVRYYGNALSLENEKTLSVKAVANIFRKLCYNNREQLHAGIIVAGWDETEGGSIYNIPLGGSIHKELYSLGGSGSAYIYGYCDTNYREGMTKDECGKFVLDSISLAISRDSMSGGCVNIANIDKSGMEHLTFQV